MTENKKGRPELTIVGGQPSKKRRKGESGTVQVPVGLEKLLFYAARDTDFKQHLLDDPAAAIAGKNMRLRPSELAMLNAVSKEALTSMIDNVVPENPKRRKFMGLVAAAAASLAAGTTEGCVDTDQPERRTKGSRPDTDSDTVDTNLPRDTEMGIRPDTDTDEVDTNQPDIAPGGIRPDTDSDMVDAGLPDGGARGVRPETDVDGGT